MSFIEDWNKQLEGLSGKSRRAKFRRLVRGSGIEYEVVRGMGYWMNFSDGRTFIYLDGEGKIKIRGDMPEEMPRVKTTRKSKPKSPAVGRPSGGQIYGYGNLLVKALPYKQTRDPGQDVFLYWDLSELYIQASLKGLRNKPKTLKEELDILVSSGAEIIASRVNELGVFPEKAYLNFYGEEEGKVTYGALGVGPIHQ